MPSREFSLVKKTHRKISCVTWTVILPPLLVGLLIGTSSNVSAREYHVAKDGNDTNEGSPAQPFLTISTAADAAMPGDTVIVHEGVYREWIDPPRGGTSNERRITYRAPEGEHVVIKGSECLRNWERLDGGVWKAVVPNTLFGDFNPFAVELTGDWLVKGHWTHLGEVYLNERSLFETKTLEGVLKPTSHREAVDQEASRYTWFAKVDDQATTIWANFHEFNPNEESVEINVRRSCFYPSRTRRHFITIDGFTMMQAATPWAPPTAEQIGLIGTNWSKGWIIQNCTISNSKNSGITLGKDWYSGHNGWEKAKITGAEHYTRMVMRAKTESAWEPEMVGSHVIRNNVIFDCEQTGICGSLGCIFSKVYDNHIYNIWVKRLARGAETAAIKFHAPVDTLIRHNLLHHSAKGMWLDWMTQGTRVTGNICFANEGKKDLHIEVNHGPFVVDNNVFLSGIRSCSEGGVYAHNLIAGEFQKRLVLDRYTQFLKPHSTDIMGRTNILGGDDRIYNNIFIKDENIICGEYGPFASGYGLEAYNRQPFTYPLFAANNLYYSGAKPYLEETGMVESETEAKAEIVYEDGAYYLELSLDDKVDDVRTKHIHSEMLGRALITQLPYGDYDGAPLSLDTDFLGERRDLNRPMPGPFENVRPGTNRIRVW